MKALLLFLLLLSAALPAFADPPDEPAPVPEDVHRPRTEGGLKWFAEVGAGLNYSLMSGNPLYRDLYEGTQRDLYESASGLGLLTYSAIGLRLSPMLGIVLRGDYDQRSASRSVAARDTVRATATGEILGTAPVQRDYDFTINYETLSLLAELNFDDLHLFVGPAVSIGVSSEFNETNTIQESSDFNLFYFLGSRSQTKTITGHEEVTDSLAMRFAIKVGVGYQFEVAPKFTVVPRLGFDYGFTEALTGDPVMKMVNGSMSNSDNLPYFINKAFKLSALQLSIGVRFTP